MMVLMQWFLESEEVAVRIGIDSLDSSECHKLRKGGLACLSPESFPKDPVSYENIY